jgi:hypothetical protein
MMDVKIERNDPCVLSNQDEAIRKGELERGDDGRLRAICGPDNAMHYPQGGGQFVPPHSMEASHDCDQGD